MDEMIRNEESEYINEKMLPWIDGVVEQLRDNMLVAEQSVGLDEWPGIRVYGAEGKDIFFTVKPFETDSGQMYLASFTDMRLMQEAEDGPVTFRRIEFPLEDERMDLQRLLQTLKLFDLAMTDRLAEALPESLLSVTAREISRLNGLKNALASVGVGSSLVSNEGEPPVLQVEDDSFSFMFSCLWVGPDEDGWLLTAECFEDSEEEEKFSVRFDVPEQGGPQTGETYGHLIEIAESLLLSRKEDGWQ